MESKIVIPFTVTVSLLHKACFRIQYPGAVWPGILYAVIHGPAFHLDGAVFVGNCAFQNIHVSRDKVAGGPCPAVAGNQLFRNINFGVFAVYRDPERFGHCFYQGFLRCVRVRYYQFDGPVVVIADGYCHLVQAVGQAVITRFFAGGKEIIVSARVSAAESIVFEVFKQGGLAYSACNFLDRPSWELSRPGRILVCGLGGKSRFNIRVA